MQRVQSLRSLAFTSYTHKHEPASGGKLAERCPGRGQSGETGGKSASGPGRAGVRLGQDRDTSGTRA